MSQTADKAFINTCPHCTRNHACTACGRREPRGKLTATDWLADLPGNDTIPKLVEVIFKNTRVGFYENPQEIPVKIGDLIVVEGAPGYDIGRVNMIGHLVKLQMKKAGFKDFKELKSVLRLAHDEDLAKFEEARSREHSTMIKARSIAEELGLAMKIGDVEYQGDGTKAIFYYIADERVDFRKLIRILAETFKVRIEMKQIGARQEAGRIGGIGPCGRPLCCSSWMNRFASVGTGAARIQDLSMNPQKLAGQCGKLKCCINFEIDSYAEAHKDLPPKDAHLETKDNLYYLFKTDILAKKLTYSTDRHIPSNLVTIDADRAIEIIELNKKGYKPDLLSDEIPEEVPSEFGDIIGQDSLTRFDKKKKNKKKNKNQKNPSLKPEERKEGKEQPKENKDSKEVKETKEFKQTSAPKNGDKGKNKRVFHHNENKKNGNPPHQKPVSETN